MLYLVDTILCQHHMILYRHYVMSVEAGAVLFLDYVTYNQGCQHCVMFKHCLIFNQG